MNSILIIEDEKDLAELVAFNLRQEGFRVSIALDGQSGLESIKIDRPDLLILDLMLPNILGTEVCRLLKQDPKTSAIPVLMLTAKGEEIDRVVGFEVGADDYVSKPFSVRELVLRVKSLLRRTVVTPEKGRLIRIGGLLIDTNRHYVTADDEEVVLTTTEFKLLLTLAERQGFLQSRDTLLKDVWGYNYVGDTRTVDTHIKRLRTKLKNVADLIHTVRGFGYKLEEA